MKRYFLFIGRTYYPNSGMGDFKGDFSTIDESKQAILDYYNLEFEENKGVFDSYDDFITNDIEKYNWEIIYDSDERKNVYIRE